MTDRGIYVLSGCLGRNCDFGLWKWKHGCNASVGKRPVQTVLQAREYMG